MFEKKSDLKASLDRALRELESCEARWRNIIAKSPHGILIVDTAGTIRFANPTATAIFGCRTEELLGEHFEMPASADKPAELSLKSRDGRTVVVELWRIETEWRGEPAWFIAMHDTTERKKSEQELRKLYRAMTESPSMVMITDARGNIEYVNPKFTEVTGYTLAEAVGQNPRFLKSDKTPPQTYKELWETIAADKEWRGEMVNRKKNGDIYWESASIAPVTDFEGNITNFIAVTEDITEKKRMEEALQDSEALFRIIFDQAFQLMGLMKPDGTLIRMNRTAAEFIKAKGPKALGKPVPFKALEPLFPPSRDEEAGVIGKLFWETPWWTHSPELQERLRDAVRRASQGEVVRFEATHLTPEGNAVWVDFSLTPVMDEEGNVVLLVPEGRDITERKMAEEALRDSEERFRATFDQAAVGIAHLDPTGRLLRINRRYCEIVGYTEEELQNLTFQQITHPDDLEASVRQFTLLRAGKLRNFSLEKRYIRKDGSPVWVNLTASMVYGPEGEQRYTVSVIEDITERRRAEEALTESRNLAQAIITSALDAIVEIDEAGTILVWNPKAEEIFGWTAEEAIGKRPSETIIPPQYREAHEKGLEHFRATGEGPILNKRVELTALHRDGHEFPVELTVTPIRTGDGYTFTAFLRDITEREQAEEALRFSEARYRALFRDNPTMIVTLDAEWTMLTVNPACADQLGYTIDELEGQSVLKLFHDEDRPLVAEQLRMCMEHPDQVYRWRFRKTHKDGRVIWVEEIAQAVNGTDGAFNLLVVCQDITERKRMEDELKNTSRQLAMILASAGEGILGLDREGNHTFVNGAAAAMLGYDPDELVGKPSHSTWHHTRPDGSPYPAEECPVYAAYREGATHSGEEMFWKKDGSGFPVEFTSRPIFSDEGTTGAVLTFKDITERKQAEEEIEKLNTDLAARAAELEAANLELEAFNYSVSHDLRKPLTVINGYCQAITELCGDKLDKQCKGYLRETYDGTLRMNQLIDALLNFSRLTRVELKREPVDIGELAQAVVAELQMLQPGRRATFRIAEGIRVEGDANLLRVVLENLLGNAWKYTERAEEAVIEFGATEIDGKPACFVRDNGPGFDMAYADKLFVPFQRLPGTDEFKGHGIGLATVERIVRRHGGRVWAEGEPGKGATFWFTLPD